MGGVTQKAQDVHLGMGSWPCPCLWHKSALNMPRCQATAPWGAATYRRRLVCREWGVRVPMAVEGRGRVTEQFEEVTAGTALMSHRAGHPGGRVRVPQVVPVPAPKALSPGTARMGGQLAEKASRRRWPPPLNVMGAVGQLPKARGSLKRLRCEQEGCRSALHAAP